jgi:hypothetical protein
MKNRFALGILALASALGVATNSPSSTWYVSGSFEEMAQVLDGVPRWFEGSIEWNGDAWGADPSIHPTAAVDLQIMVKQRVSTGDETALVEVTDENGLLIDSWSVPLGDEGSTELHSVSLNALLAHCQPQTFCSTDIGLTAFLDGDPETEVELTIDLLVALKGSSATPPPSTAYANTNVYSDADLDPI